MTTDEQYYKARDNHREKRQFMQMATCALLFSGTTKQPRDVVNRAHELWDELVTQCPEPKEPDK